jgi:hypothetical protein
MNDQDEYPFALPMELEWLASHSLCDPETAAGDVGRKLFSREVFADSRASKTGHCAPLNCWPRSNSGTNDAL